MESWNPDSIMQDQLNQIDRKYNLGSCQESEITSSQETRIDDQNDVGEAIDSDATTEVDSISMDDDPVMRNNRIFDENLGDNHFSDESDVEVSVVSVVPKISKNPSSLLLTPINKAWRQRRRGKEEEMESTSSQSTVQSTTSQSQTTADKDYEPDTSSMSTTTDADDSIDLQSKQRTRPKKRKRPVAPRSSTPIPIIDLPEDDDDDIPDFDNVDNYDDDDNENTNKENHKINVLGPSQINERYSQEIRRKSEDEIVILPADSSREGSKPQQRRKKCLKTRRKNTQKKLFQEGSEDLEFVVKPENSHEITVDPDQLEIVENNQTQPKKERKGRKPRPGKEYLLDHLKSLIGAETEDICEEEIFQAFCLKTTLFKSTGYAPGHCVCKMPVKEEQPNQIMFEMESNIASGKDNEKVELCPKCFVILMNSGNNEERKTFLRMVYELQLGIPATYIRSDGPNSRIFELPNKKWLKDLKKSNDLKKFKSFKVQGEKTYLELLPCTKNFSKLRKAIRNNPGEKMKKIFVQVYTMNGQPNFRLRDVEVEHNMSSSSHLLQTSMVDFIKSPKVSKM